MAKSKKTSAKRASILLGPPPPEPVWHWHSHHASDPVAEPERQPPAVLSDDELLDRAMDLGLYLPEQVEAYLRGVRHAEQTSNPTPVAAELLEREDEDLGIQPDLVP